MITRRFAGLLGLVYLVVGVAGFIPGLANAAPAGAPHMTVDFDYNFLAGMFPINVLHNIVHILIGLAGIGASRQYDLSRTFARGLAVLYGLLAVMGMIPGLNTVFGLIPLFDGDVVLHLLTALVAGYFGFLRREEASDTTGIAAAHPVAR